MDDKAHLLAATYIVSSDPGDDVDGCKVQLLFSAVAGPVLLLFSTFCWCRVVGMGVPSGAVSRGAARLTGDGDPLQRS
jgi:hypothetical protein